MYSETYKRDKKTNAIVATDYSKLNSHRAEIEKKKMLVERIDAQSAEICELKSELKNIKSFLEKAINQKILGNDNGN